MGADELWFEGYYGARAATYGPKAGFEVQEMNRPISVPFLGGSTPSADAIRGASKKIVQFSAYPGMNLNVLQLDGISAMVLGLYHSGTAMSQGGPGSLLEFISAKSAALPIFMTTYPARYIDKPYESTVRLAAAGGAVIRDLQTHVVSTLLLIGLSQGRAVSDLTNLLGEWKLKI